MGTILVVLVVAGFLPSLAYLCIQAFRKLRARLNRVLPGEGLTQMILACVAVFCFGTGLLLVVLPFSGQIPYYRQEKGLIVSLLFLLMGVLAVQVMQFIRTQIQAGRSARGQLPGNKVKARPRANRRRTVARTYAVQDRHN